VVEGVGAYRRLGTTIDDAVGEAFDKTAKLLDLGFPGGPAVERTAAGGDPARFDLPRPMMGRPGCDFSFSGLKTAVRQAVDGLGWPLAPTDAADMAASFQAAVADVLADRAARALREAARTAGPMPLVVAGGVAANRTLRSRLEAVGAEFGVAFVAPPPRLCTDNAAMIAWAGCERLALGQADPLDLPPRARWPLDPSARAGAKA
jgi:N6-L-threonylcarbamoyladenine synthase